MVSGYEDDEPSKKKVKKHGREKKVKEEHTVVPKADPVPPAPSPLSLNDCYSTAAFVLMMIASNVVGKPLGDRDTCQNVGALGSALFDAHELAKSDFRLGVALYALAGVWHMVPEDWSWE